MNYLIRFHMLVSEDIRKAVEWYEKQQDGLGGEFDIELSHSIDRIQQAPLSHGFAFPKIRFNLLHRFPYVIYFVIVKTEIRVLAILHGRQDNSIVSERVETWPS